VSSDASPPSGIRLEAEPPWLKVIGTTLRLWLRRRVLRVPDQGKVSGTRLAAFSAAAVLLVAAAGGTAAALAGARHAGHPGRQASTLPRLTPVQIEAKANVQAAAAWIAAQVSTQTVVGCDLATCAQLEAAGFTSDVELTGAAALEQETTSQAAGGPGAMTLVVVTPAVRAQYGALVGASAPAVLASFGSGAVSVQVRELTPGGQAAYQRAARRVLAARRKAGQALAGNGRVHVHGAARLALTSGLVDPRLVALLQRVAARYPVHVARFGDSGPLASPSVPLRMAEIGGFVVSSGHKQVSDLNAILKLLRSPAAPYQAQLTVTQLAGGALMLKIAVLAPAPL
jgi:hypothetical protein